MSAKHVVCPCGSGLRRKKCCAGVVGTRRVEVAGQVRSTRLMDDRLSQEMIRFARHRFGLGVIADAADLFYGDEEPTDEEEEQDLQLVMPWFLFHFPVEGRPVVEAFLKEKRRTLSRVERAWLKAQRRAWISIWEVTRLEPGLGFTAVDLFTRQERFVRDATRLGPLAVGESLLGRIVDDGGISLMCGAHTVVLVSLPPEAIEHLAEKLFHVESGRVSMARIRGLPLSDLVRLLRAWQTLAELALSPPVLELVRTDG